MAAFPAWPRVRVVAGDRLFPVSSPPRVSMATVLATTVAFLAGTVTVLARQTGVGPLDSLYAEDGTIFLGQALRNGWSGSVAKPFAGYFHVLPRLMAEVASTLPVSSAAAALSIMAAATVAALALVVYRATNAHLRSQPIRWVVAASLVVLPAAQEEVFNNIANLHWFLLFAAVWMLFWNPRSRWEVAVASVVVALAALSDPLAAILVPLAVLRLWSVRSWLGRAHALVLLAALGMQVTWMALSGAEREGLHPSANVVRAGGQYALHVVGQAVFGARLIDDSAKAVSWVLTAAAMAFVATVAVLVARRGREHLTLAVLLALFSFAFYAVPVLSTGLSPPRYSVVPMLLLLSLTAYLLDGLEVVNGAAARAAAAAALVLVVAGWGLNFRVPNRRSVGPKWSVELARAERRCADTGRRRETVAITPDTWEIVLPCDVLRSASRSPHAAESR